MDSLQSLPFFLDPVALTIGSFSLRWYALCLLFGFFTALGVLWYRAGRTSGTCDRSCALDLAFSVFLGGLLGGRLGFALFYAPELFLSPLSLVVPIDPVSGAFVGIRGMSFFGALLGSLGALVLFARIRKQNFWDLSDMLAPVVPLTIFFGRIGNFINGELYGRVTDVPWGMYFPSAPDGGMLARHPSQLYESFLEGFLLFLVLSWIGWKERKRGSITLLFLGSYAIIRFFVEFVREPDAGSALLFEWMTTGQALALALLLAVFMAYRLVWDKGRM